MTLCLKAVRLSRDVSNKSHNLQVFLELERSEYHDLELLLKASSDTVSEETQSRFACLYSVTSFH